ncbi:MAG TPA: OB-fold nucleic acid binding domain-containing protein, partial [bacterium]|nr:OB-fold nucleic acid binding domain-containing protein [bacterium]
MKRTHKCGEIRASDIGKTVTLQGWAHRRRDHGGLIFVDLRDRDGLAQVVVEPDNKTAFPIAEKIRSEFVLEITGKVRPRPEGMKNPKLPTGEVEVEIASLSILNEARPVPFKIGAETEGQE